MLAQIAIYRKSSLICVHLYEYGDKLFDKCGIFTYLIARRVYVTVAVILSLIRVK